MLRHPRPQPYVNLHSEELYRNGFSRLGEALAADTAEEHFTHRSGEICSGRSKTGESLKIKNCNGTIISEIERFQHGRLIAHHMVLGAMIEN